MVRSAEGQLDRAVPLARECVERAQETGATACMVASSWILGDAFHRQGEFEQARDVLKRGSDVSLAMDRRVWRPTLQAWLRSSATALGEASDVDLDEALAIARSIGNSVGEAGILGKRAEAAIARGDLGSAERTSGEHGDPRGRGAAPGARADAPDLGGRAARGRPFRRGLTALPAVAGLFEEMGLDAEAAGVKTSLALGDTKLAF